MRKGAAEAPLDNAAIAGQLRNVSELLAEQEANPFRVDAYRHAAEVIEGLDRPLARIVEEGGVRGLVALPAIGQGIAAAIVEMLETGRWTTLERLSGEGDHGSVLRSVPGIGPKLAAKIHDELHVASLDGLRRAVDDGRLARLEGLGPRRLETIRACLEARLHPEAAHAEEPKAPRPTKKRRPSVATLLRVDRAYRERAARGELPTVSPRNNNPQRKRWLPVAHIDDGGWHFTALFSNTATAHRFGRTHDWVILYAVDAAGVETQYTVVTETRGRLRGRRVVRGRERECRSFYDSVAEERAPRAKVL